jgi:hypothetical protein
VQVRAVISGFNPPAFERGMAVVSGLRDVHAGAIPV